MMPKQGDDMEANQHAFGLECYKQVRSEVFVHLSRLETLLRYSILGMPVVFSWLITNGFGTYVPEGKDAAEACLKLPTGVLVLGWLIPDGFILLTGIMMLGTKKQIEQTSSFLERCETGLGHADFSWERHLRPHRSIMTNTAVATWCAIFVVALIAASAGIGLGYSLPLCPAKA